MGWLSRTFYGVDLDEEQARQDRLDVEAAALNKKKFEAGLYSAAWYDEVEGDRRASYISDVDGEVRNAFNTELDSRVASVRDFAGDAVSFSLKSILGVVPPVVWLAVLAFLAFKFGLFNGLIKKLR